MSRQAISLKSQSEEQGTVLVRIGASGTSQLGISFASVMLPHGRQRMRCWQGNEASVVNSGSESLWG